jgi:salicylate hydroxylase
MKAKIQESKAANADQSFESSLKARIGAFGGEDQLSWIYGNNIEEVWKNFVEGEKVNGIKIGSTDRS